MTVLAATVCHPAQGGSVARLLVSTPGLKLSACALPRLPRLCAPCTVGRMSRNPVYFGGVLGRSAVVVDEAGSGGVCAGVGGLFCGLVVAKLNFVWELLAVCSCATTVHGLPGSRVAWEL